MELELGRPTERRFQEICAFVEAQGLEAPAQVPDYAVTVRQESGGIAAVASLQGVALQHIAVSPALQGEGLCNRVISNLVSYAVSQGRSLSAAWRHPTTEPCTYCYHPRWWRFHALLWQGRQSVPAECGNCWRRGKTFALW